MLFEGEILEIIKKHIDISNVDYDEDLYKYGMLDSIVLVEIIRDVETNLNLNANLELLLSGRVTTQEEIIKLFDWRL